MKQWRTRPAAAALAAALALASPAAPLALGHHDDAVPAELSSWAALDVGPAASEGAAWHHQGRGRGGPGAQRDDDKRDDDEVTARDRGPAGGHGRGLGRGRDVQDDDEVSGQGQGRGRGLAGGPARGTGGGATRGRDHREEAHEGDRDCSPPWQNHGHYVNCVARGEVEVDGESVDEVDNPGSVVREAAQSDVGKSDGDGD